jgi:hypothetical protein
MTFDYTLWKKDFSPDSVPKFPCPSCEHGRLQIEKETLRIVEAQYSKAAHSHVAWEPDWNVQRFSMTLRCNIDTCGEIVIFSGDAPVKMFAGEDDWDDMAACANRLRASVETLLNELKIPTQGTSKKGKVYDLNLS